MTDQTESTQTESTQTEPTQTQPASPSDSLTPDSIAAAETLFDLTFTDSERELMLEDVRENRKNYEKMHAVSLDNSVPPAFHFDPRVPGMALDVEPKRLPLRTSEVNLPPLPGDLEEVAFWPVTYLSELIRSRKVSSQDLTEMYLRRLKRFDPALHCVITLTEDLAMEQAHRADNALRRGNYWGPLHGVPYGAKDLLATRGIPTTWGAEPYRDQVPDLNATVVERLEAAGAVLVAKLAVGALAWGDYWFDQQTKTPWNLEEGSSGSSAGSGAATAAGLVGFSIGTETLGSIVSPSTQCRVTGLRPTFGRVSRHGAMALSWTMDKIGPMCRAVEDCALVFNAIYGPDGKDMTVSSYPFNWDPNINVRNLRIGYAKAAFEADHEGKEQDDKALEVLRSLGIDLIPISGPSYPIDAIVIILGVEAAAAFDELTRSNRDEMLARQVKDAWPNAFRVSRMVPAVEYIQANRIRTLLMQAMADLMADIDVYVSPSFGSGNLILTNLTGHPAVVVPNGVTAEGKPVSLTFTGRLYGEAKTLAVAKTYQGATSFHEARPPLA